MIAESFLFKSVEIHRHMNPLWYVATVVVTCFTLLILYKKKHVKFGLFIILVSLLMNLVWELILYGFKMRVNKDGFFVNLFEYGWVLEIIFHGIFETGSTLALGIEALDYFKIVNIDGVLKEINAFSKTSEGGKSQ